MGFGMFSVHHSPIAIDFGSASIKLLQLGDGDRPPLLAAAELPIPDSIRSDTERVLAYGAEWLPVSLRDGRFKGKRAVITVPSTQTFVQHMPITETEGVGRDDLVKGLLQTQMGCPPHGVVVRSHEVCTVYRNSASQKEMICFAIAKDTVMKYVELLTKCKLEVVGVHTDTLAMVRAFDHIHRRAEDDNVTTLYIELGWGGTRVAITHGKKIAFARSIPIGGKQFDQLIASAVKCDITSARAHRLALRATKTQASGSSTTTGASSGSRTQAAGLASANGGGSDDVEAEMQTAVAERRSGQAPASLKYTIPPGEGIRSAVNVDLSELLDTISDELSMCRRYHQGLFRDRQIDRAILVGGESRQAWLCQHIVKSLRVPAQLGDPLARVDSSSTPPTPNFKPGQPQPGWAVAYGLCSAHAEM